MFVVVVVFGWLVGRGGLRAAVGWEGGLRTGAGFEVLRLCSGATP